LDTILITSLISFPGLVGLGVIYLDDKMEEKYKKCLQQAPKIEYKVKWLDTLWNICRDYKYRDACIEVIEDINNLVGGLKAGTTIYIPDEEPCR
jgi:hypothetical protein